MTPAQHLALHAVLRDVAAERHRQHAKHGEQYLSDFASYWGTELTQAIEERARKAQADGFAGWSDVLAEEFCEAIRARGYEPSLRAELVQVAAVAVQWIEAIDRRAAAVKGD